MMEKIVLPKGFKNLSYDEFTWSDNLRVISKDFVLLTLSISEYELISLSEAVYLNYLEILNDVPDYFNNWNEPYPLSKDDIYKNPIILGIYFSKSSLWSDFLIKTISKIQKWDFQKSKYHLLRFDSVDKLENNFYIIFLAIETKSFSNN